MPLPIDITAKTKAEHLLHSHWRPSAIASELRNNDVNCSLSTVYSWSQRQQMFGTIEPLPHALHSGRPRRVTTAAKKALLEYQRRRP